RFRQEERPGAARQLQPAGGDFSRRHVYRLAYRHRPGSLAAYPLDLHPRPDSRQHGRLCGVDSPCQFVRFEVAFRIAFAPIEMSELAYFGSFSYPQNLRRELSQRNQIFAKRQNLAHQNSYGELPIACYVPSENESEHGNFLPETYRAIVRNPDWRRRLDKVHAQARTALPRSDRRWRELDSCTSSDALLMNVFCFPGSPTDRRLLDLLGVVGDPPLQFGFKARVPLANGKFDRTEVDLRMGDLLIEAKLTETD